MHRKCLSHPRGRHGTAARRTRGNRVGERRRHRAIRRLAHRLGAKRAELAGMPLGESVKRCFLGPLNRFLGGLGVPPLPFDAETGVFDPPADWCDG